MHAYAAAQLVIVWHIDRSAFEQKFGSAWSKVWSFFRKRDEEQLEIFTAARAAAQANAAKHRDRQALAEKLRERRAPLEKAIATASAAVTAAQGKNPAEAYSAVDNYEEALLAADAERAKELAAWDADNQWPPADDSDALMKALADQKRDGPEFLAAIRKLKRLACLAACRRWLELIFPVCLSLASALVFALGMLPSSALLHCGSGASAPPSQVQSPARAPCRFSP
jgi:hypothetical protein